jgi:hypothetical protein
MTRIVGALIAAGLRRALFVGAMLVGIALAAPAQAQNIVVNGGAETGDFTGWPNVSGWVVTTSPVHTGSNAFVTGAVGIEAYFAQSLSLTVGATYNVSLWVANSNCNSPSSGLCQPNSFSVRLGTGVFPIVVAPVISQANTPIAYTFYSGTFTATNATELLQIGGRNDPAGIFIDDICVSLSSFCGNALVPQLPAGSPINPTNVAAAIDAFTNAGGTLPAGFQNLFGLTPNQLVAALNQLSGEAATGAQTGAFELMNSFLGLMVDQSLDAGNGNSVGLASGFAPERQALPTDVALAYPRCSRRRAPRPASHGAPGARPMAAPTTRLATLPWWEVMTCARTPGASPQVSTTGFRPTPRLASRSVAPAPTGACRMGSAAAKATPSRPASTA